MGLILLFDLYTIYQHLLIHRIRRELVEREELFHLISENAADMIAIVDMEGRRIFNSLSYQKVMGYSPEELHASSAFEQIHPDDQKRVKEAAEEARHSGIGQTLEYRLRHKNGTWLVLESTSSVIRNANGGPEKLVIVNRNITERKRAEEALRRSEADFRSVVEDAPLRDLSRKHQRSIPAGQPGCAENAGLRTGARAFGKRPGYGHLPAQRRIPAFDRTSHANQRGQRHRDGVEAKR